MSRDELDIRALRRVTSQIFDFIQNELKLDRVKLGRDFYWSVPHDALHDVGNPPKELVVGSLIDDLGFATSADKDGDQAIPLTLIHIAPILRALATVVPGYKPPDEGTQHNAP